MELSELTAYAGEKYQIREQHLWADFPGFSVLCDPHTGKWVALLMRQWDSERGMQIECCDLKCGKQSLLEFDRPYLSAPVRMRGSQWVNVSFGSRTEPEVVFRLLDRALGSGERRAYTVILENSHSSVETGYRDTPLPFFDSAYQPPKETVPARLREMRRLYEYGREALEARAKNFLRQGRFMQDYEDDVPWTGDFVCYYPTYHDLSLAQLRGYFTWRAGVRKGEFRPIPSSAAYLYVYELLNGIGAASPEDRLQKLRDFEEGYLNSGIGDGRMRQNLRRWMSELAVLLDLPPETARQYTDPELLRRDEALAALHSPDNTADDILFSALCFFGGKSVAESPVLSAVPERGPQLFCAIWRSAATYHVQGQDLFTLCFGEPKVRPWYPLANAVYDPPDRPADRDYILDACRTYRFRHGLWQVETYDRSAFDRDRFRGLLHEADLRLRRWLKTGRYLRPRPEDAWAIPLIDAVLEADRRARLEAARPKIQLDLSGLDRIREDALVTRDSLLTEEELAEFEDFEETEAPAPEEEQSELPLDALQLQILRSLLRGDSVTALIREKHLLPSLIADAVNEALFDEFGDTVLTCEDGLLSLVEDYREDLMQLLGGM